MTTAITLGDPNLSVTEIAPDSPDVTRYTHMARVSIRITGHPDPEITKFVAMFPLYVEYPEQMAVMAPVITAAGVAECRRACGLEATA